MSGVELLDLHVLQIWLSTVTRKLLLQPEAGNILIDSRGATKLGDLGVSACLFEAGDRQRMRNTFVGTPCWMAPEVMEQLHGYDFKADIWSFGITALELAHGHAPFSKYPPMKVLLMTLQNAPPGLDYERDKKFSRSFKQMIASCLVKDPSKRPSAKKLLKHSFFKQARSNDYIARTLLEGLPALGDRLQALKKKEEDMLAQKKIPDGQKEEISQNEYKRGISCWDFNLEDLKAQASLIPDDDSLSEKEQGGISNSSSAFDMNDQQLLHQSSSVSQCSDAADVDDNNLMRNQPASSSADFSVTCTIGKFEKYEEDIIATISLHEQQNLQNSNLRNESHIENKLSGTSNMEISASFSEGVATYSHQNRAGSSGNMTTADTSSCKGESDFRRMPSFNGDPSCQIVDDMRSVTASKVSKSSANSEEQDEKVKGPVVQQKGRFKVTSENATVEKVVPSPIYLSKSHSMQVIPQHPPISLQSPSDVAPPIEFGHSLFPMLQSILQTNILQREGVLTLMKQLSFGDSTDGGSTSMTSTIVEKSLLETAHEREKELIHELTDLQWRLICAQEELQKCKTENAKV